MKLRQTRVQALHLLSSALVWLPLAVHAQLPTPAPQIPVGKDGLVDWRGANDAVGQNPRGHADILRWEEKNVPTTAAPKPAPDALALPSPAAAVRESWRRRYELASTLAILGTANVDRIAEGRWSELDPYLQRNIHGMSAVLKGAADVRKVWLNAVAARQVVAHHRAIVAANDSAAELGRRMAAVGNWSKLQHARVETAAVAARLALQRATYAASRSDVELARVLHLTGVRSSFDLPATLPDVPAQPLTAEALHQRLAGLTSLLTRAERFRVASDARIAINAYEASHAIAFAHQGTTAKLRDFIAEESVLRYNGMFISVWQLLEEAAARSRAALEAVDAQLDFWIAETDLQLVLQGESPDSFVSLGAGGGGSPSAAAPH